MAAAHWFWEELPFFRLLLPFAAGIICADQGFAIDPACAVALIAVSGAGLLLPRYPAIPFLCSQLLMLLFALLLCPAAGPHRIVSNARGWIVIVAETAPKKLIAMEPQSGEKLLIWNRGPDADYGPGDTLLIAGGISQIRPSGSPFEPDFAGHFRRKGIAFQVQPKRIFSIGKANPSWLIRMQRWCALQLRTHVPDAAAQGLLEAILLGEESHFDPAVRDSYVNTGIIHVVAISGSHVALMFAMIGYAFFWLRKKQHEWIKYLFALVFAWVYVMMAGAPPSAVRSVMMFSLLSVGTVFRKQQHALNQLLGTSFLLLMFRPAWLFSIGFQLSFLAVLSLMLFYSRIYKLWPQRTGIGKFLWSAICASLAAEVLTAPLVIFYFHLFPVQFLITNLAACLLMNLVMVAGIAVIGLSFLPAVPGMIGACIAALVKGFNGFIAILESWNPPAFRYLYLDGWGLIGVYTFVLLIAVALVSQRTRPALLALTCGCGLLCQSCIYELNGLKQQRLVVWPGKGSLRISGKRSHYSGHPGAFPACVKSAQTGWKAWKENPVLDPRLFCAGSKTVVVLDSIPAGAAVLEAGVIVLNTPVRYKQLSRISRLSTGQLIVIGKINAFTEAALHSRCQSRGIKLKLHKGRAPLIFEDG